MPNLIAEEKLTYSQGSNASVASEDVCSSVFAIPGQFGYRVLTLDGNYGLLPVDYPDVRYSLHRS
jgi:hypothetical protein